MSKPLTIKTTRAVWINQYHTADELLAYVERGEVGRCVDILSIYGPPEMKEFGQGYTRVGEAEITLILMPRDQQVAEAVKALNKKLEELRTAYLHAQQEVLDRINKLQAITYVDEAQS